MNFEPITHASLAIQIHLVAAIIAIVLFLSIALMRRGTKLHKFTGRIWVAIIGITAISSFWINEIDHFMGFSAIHLLSVFTLVNCYLGVRAIRRGDIRAHRGAMISIAIGGLVIAGGFAFMPGRILHHVFIAGGI
jgi:uncharacterized membrane protein